MKNPTLLLSIALLAAGTLSADALARDDGRRDGRHGHSAPSHSQPARERGSREQAPRRGNEAIRDSRGHAQDSRRHADAAPARHRDHGHSRHDGRRDGHRDGYRHDSHASAHSRHRGHSRPVVHQHNYYYGGSNHYRHTPRRHPAHYYAPQRYRAPVRYVYPTGHYISGWHVGTYLPRHYYAPSYYVDYRHYGLMPPPRGHYWVRIDSDVVLVAIATGLVTRVLYDLFYY